MVDLAELLLQRVGVFEQKVLELDIGEAVVFDKALQRSYPLEVGVVERDCDGDFVVEDKARERLLHRSYSFLFELRDDGIRRDFTFEVEALGSREDGNSSMSSSSSVIAAFSFSFGSSSEKSVPCFLLLP